MNLYRHILAKDCKRLAVPLAIWLLLLGLNHYLMVANNSALGTIPEQRLGFNALLATWSLASTVCFWFLAIYNSAGVILEDPPKGTASFWLTRPFARGEMIAAKLTWLAGIAILPPLVNSVLLISLGVGPKGVLVTLLSGLLNSALLPFVAAAFAVTAETFGAFAITSLVILFGCAVWSAISGGLWAFHQMARMNAGVHSGPLPRLTLGESKELVGQIVTLILAMGIVFWRYQRRHARFVIGVVAAASLLCMLIPMFWPWDFISASKYARESAVPSVDGIQFTLRTARVRRDNSARFQLQAIISASPQGPHAIVIPRTLSDERLVWSNGDSSTVGEMMIPQPAIEMMEPESLVKVVAPLRILNSHAKIPAPFVLPTGGAADHQRLQVDTATFKSRVDAFVLDCRVTGEISLANGARAVWGSRPMKIVEHHVTATGGEAISLQSGFITTPVALLLGAGEIPSQAGAIAPLNPVYLLVNRSRNEALILADQGRAKTTNFGGYNLHQSVLTVEGENVDEEWEKGATLVCVEYHLVGKATGSVESKPFDLAP